MISVLGRNTSSNVQTVMWALAELGLPHERHDMGGSFGGLDSADYTAMNPNRLIPVLRDGDVTLWESAAILRYLAAAYGDDGFWPEPRRRAPLDMWAEWIKTTWTPVMQAGIFWALIRTPAAKRDAARLADLVARAKSLAGMLDQRIGAGPWMDGETFTFADIMCGHLLYRYYTLDFERAETPNLDAYYQRLTERPAYAEHVMISYDGLRVE
ncbi:glutathione S-transferase [Paralimibaculum aggregatum]|uniref:Glutathione S-transferase n=1 Tax=Paralimibaculum aggregatum TaxID=3036245 RepID=A0ABQ6LME9_9RHOB|nr:glutathione S-transferase family protein [Limibaculum sp. NKW23]GMG83465.1 glutathione S-transferase [Limibaculum sp. NKW23]